MEINRGYKVSRSLALIPLPLLNAHNIEGRNECSRHLEKGYVLDRRLEMDLLSEQVLYSYTSYTFSSTCINTKYTAISLQNPLRSSVYLSRPTEASHM